LVVYQFTAIAQLAKDTAVSTKLSSSQNQNFVQKLQKLGTAKTGRSIEKYKDGQIAIKQKSLIEEIKNITEHANLIMKKGLDTLV
jgi:hypothetical protein